MGESTRMEWMIRLRRLRNLTAASCDSMNGVAPDRGALTGRDREPRIAGRAIHSRMRHS